MKEKLKEHTGAILGIIVLIVILSVLSIFGSAIMKLFGFQYDSIGTVMTFFILVGALGFPIEQFAIGFPKALLKLKKINVTVARVIFFVLDTFATF